MPGVVIGVNSISDLEVELTLDSANGESRYTQRFSLSRDRHTLTDQTNRNRPVVRIRCDMPRQRLIGLLEIAALRPLDSGKPDTAASPVTLRNEPHQDAPVAAEVNDYRELVTREHGYEENSAVVYSRSFESGGRTWYKLGYSVGDNSGFGWLDPASRSIFRDNYDLVSRRMAYLTPDWDKRLHARPDSQSPARTPGGIAEEAPAVKVLDLWTDRATMEDWYLVAMMNGHCGDGPPEVIAAGWVRAFAPNGGNTVWFYSRGC
jgi:hypothetical protein